MTKSAEAERPRADVREAPGERDGGQRARVARRDRHEAGAARRRHQRRPQWRTLVRGRGGLGRTRRIVAIFLRSSRRTAYNVLHVGYDPARCPKRRTAWTLATRAALERAPRPRARAARDLPRRVRRRSAASRAHAQRLGDRALHAPRRHARRRAGSVARAATCSSSSRCPARATASGRAARFATTSSAWISCTAPASSSSTWRAAISGSSAITCTSSASEAAADPSARAQESLPLESSALQRAMTAMRRLAVALLLVLLGSPSARADWEVKRSPFDARVVARYKQLVHANPDDADALARLTALYKQYKSVDALTRELVATAEKSREANDWIAVGNVARNRGDFAGAAKAYAAALERAPDDARALAALGDADVRLGKGAEARPLYERALAQTKDAQAAAAALEEADRSGAGARSRRAGQSRRSPRRARYYDALVQLDPRDDDARATVGRGAGGARAARRSGRRVAHARRPGSGAIRRGRARRGCAPASSPRRRATTRGARRLRQDVRAGAEGQLPATRSGRQDRRARAQARRLRTLAGEWERAWPDSGRDFAEWELLGRLYDELGDADKAQAAFKRALALDPHALDARRRLIALYERTGRDAEVVAEYRRLIAVGAGRAALPARARRAADEGGQSRRGASRSRRRSGASRPIRRCTRQLAELYSRWNLAELALREQELLVRLEPGDDAHLVALGELWWQKGNKKRALELWKKLLDRGPKVAAMTRLAEVYVEHDMAPEALDLYREGGQAGARRTSGVQKGLGSTLERLHRDGEAQEMWASLFERAAEKHDRPAQLEARQRLIVIAQRAGRLGIIAGQYREQALRTRKQRRGRRRGVHAAGRRRAREDGAHGDGRGASAQRSPTRRALASLRADALDGPRAGGAGAPSARRRAGGAEEGGRAGARARPRALSADRRAVAAALSGRRRAELRQARGAARAGRRGGDGAARRGAGEARGSRRRGAGLRARARDRRSAVEGLLHAGAAAHPQRRRRRARPSSIAR